MTTQEDRDLAAAGQQQAGDGQHHAHRVDDEHGLAVAEAKIEQPVVEVAAVGAEWRPPDETRRMMIQNVSMIGTPRTSSARATLAVPMIDSTASA